MWQTHWLSASRLKKFNNTDRVFLGVDDVDGGHAGEGRGVAVGEGVRQVDGATET
jgi:hypothetical protein